MKAENQTFSELIKAAPIRTAMASFNGLFQCELVVTSRDELEAANEAARTETLNRKSGQYEKRLDEVRFRAWLATRVAGFSGLTLKKALTLCGRAVPEEMAARGGEALACKPDTVETLLNMVVGFQVWLISELGTIAAIAARADEDSLEN